MKEVNKKQKKFEKICDDIKEIKIQGAKNIAKKALEAYHLIPTKKSLKKLLSLRPTEPLMMNILKRAEKESYEKLKNHFDEAQKKINKFVLKEIKSGDIIFTHCHSTNVVNSLIYAKKNKKNFEVYNTETRPLFQGRKTAKELREHKIPVTMFVDSAMGVALSKEQGTKKVTKIFLGADALLKKGVVNKIGSGTIAKLAKIENIPVYIIADSWKYSNKNIKLEKRKIKEVWNKIRKSKNFSIENPAFELILKKYISGIFTELGFMTYSKFLKEMKK